MAFENSNLPGLEGIERLVVPSDKSNRSFIPFGIDGILVIISQYGEILRLSKNIAEDNPRVICLNSPDSSMAEIHLPGHSARIQRAARIRRSGLSICLAAQSKVEVPIETRLEWINGRWPCVHYEIDGILVSVLLTVNEGVLSQQFFIKNPSSENKSVGFALQIQGATATTLRVRDGRWAPSDMRSVHRPKASGHYSIIEGEDKGSSDGSLQQEDDNVKNATRGEAVITVFHGSELLELDRTACVPISSYYSPSRDDEDSDDLYNDTQNTSDRTIPSVSSGVLPIASKGVEKLVLQYRLQSHSGEKPRSPKCQDVETFLKRDQSRNWSFKEDHKLNSVFRRYLEHILCLCLVHVTPHPGGECRIPFMNDVTLEFGSTPLGDLYVVIE